MKTSTLQTISRLNSHRHHRVGARLLAGLAMLFAVLAVAGCGGFLQNKKVAADAMDQFHERFNAGEFDKIYDTADGQFQSATARVEFLKFIETVHRKLGDYKSCDDQSTNVSIFNGDTRVTLRYKTAFTKGTGDEEFIFRIAGSRAVLLGYHINSNALITE